MHILHIIPTLDHNGAAAQLELLAKRMRGAHQLQICCLGGDSSRAARLRGQGLQVDCLRWTRTFDPAAWLRFRDILKSGAPDLLHVWGLPALRALALAGRRWLADAMVSLNLHTASSQINRLDRWCLQRVRMVAAGSSAEATACRQLGLADRQVTVIPPGVEMPGVSTPANIVNDSQPARDILCIGPLEPRKGFRDAIWGLDILRFVFTDARLTLVGDGSHRDYLEWFTGCVKLTDSVRFHGPCDDVTPLLARGSVLWAPAVGSRHAVLQAMAAGLPVVAADHPAMRELVTDGETGCLIPAGDKIAICKKTRSLFVDDGLARTMSAAARRHVAQHFDADLCAQRWRWQYSSATSTALAA
jgi:glycosyltransferase involved in cell wall biosynthesis